MPGPETVLSILWRRTMKKILVTGGTVFVSRYIAEYYVAAGYEVHVLNRNTRSQAKGVTLIQADRNMLGDKLRDQHFDLVIDTGYTGTDVNHLLDALGSFENYIFVSSSAVYPEYSKQPFTEAAPLNANVFWGKYGTDKIEAETVLAQRFPEAYILRPPYLYGKGNNVYREAFVFDCALGGRKFYLPKDGEMGLQFFHVHDLCRFIDILVERKPDQHIFNVGNKDKVSIREWVRICYEAAGSRAEFVNVYDDMDQRNYFSFYDYEYYLDVTKQQELLNTTKPLEEGLKEAFDWYRENRDEVNKKPYMEFIDKNLK